MRGSRCHSELVLRSLAAGPQGWCATADCFGFSRCNSLTRQVRLILRALRLLNSMAEAAGKYPWGLLSFVHRLSCT